MMKPIYVIDDDDDVRDVIVFALENEKFPVKSFCNGKEAFDALKNIPVSEMPGLIIVDYLMPEMDGYEFINAVRKIPKLENIKIVLSTAMGHSDPDKISMENILELHKPMDLDDLINVVKEHCS